MLLLFIVCMRMRVTVEASNTLLQQDRGTKTLLFVVLFFVFTQFTAH